MRRVLAMPVLMALFLGVAGCSERIDGTASLARTGEPAPSEPDSTEGPEPDGGPQPDGPEPAENPLADIDPCALLPPDGR